MQFPHWCMNQSEGSHIYHEGAVSRSNPHLSELVGNYHPSLVSKPSSHIDKGKRLG